jgi:hypothetical protein
MYDAVDDERDACESDDPAACAIVFQVEKNSAVTGAHRPHQVVGPV